MTEKVTNIVIAGLGGQGVIRASDILAYAAFLSGYDVKKSEIHGMSQRGGSVHSDIRFGSNVLSPMIPAGTADFLVMLSEDQVETNMRCLGEHGKLISCNRIRIESLPNKRCQNVAMMGILSMELPIDQDLWIEAIRMQLPKNLHAINEQAFALGTNS